MINFEHSKYPVKKLKQSIRIAFTGALVFCFTAFFLSFYQFASQASKEANLRTLPKADAIVVLTGEGGRISSAVKLLNARNGKRLLISGVSQKVSDKTVYETFAAQNAERYCCIDLDRLALDTKGNAKYTADWVSLHNFKQVIVVTSSYHMPRSLEHMRKKMPNVDIIPAQIIPADLKGKSTLAMMTAPKVIIEYGKFLLTRTNLEPMMKYMMTSLNFKTNS